VDALDPTPESIYIEDVAAALSKTVRWTGNLNASWTVADHSLLCVDLILGRDARAFDDALYALLHDGPEFILGDVPRPLKYGTIMGVEYLNIEAKMMRAFEQRFDLANGAQYADGMPPIVKWADNVCVALESRDFGSPEHREEFFNAEAYNAHPIRLRPLGPAFGYARFMLAYTELNNRRR
jgi:5'-deoxynucleotidase YfbR-like HD superfamily hydrolase